MFKYIMTCDDDGNEVRILKSKTHYPFFSFYIQERKKENIQNPSSEEEQCIKASYEYLYDCLEEQKLRDILKKKYGNNDVDQLKYVDMLKALRDQVLNTTFVSISTKDRKQANMIFEILNAKGKNLSCVDLIKNAIFELVTDVEPADFAEEKWKTIKSIINDSEIGVGFVQFYRHFWISKYKKSSVAKLYDDFKTTIKPKSKERYKKFLLEMEECAKLYVKVVAPQKKDFDNKKEYFGVIQSMTIMSDVFNIVQVRLALMALVEAKSNDLITLTQLKECLYYLEGFHFSYNTLAARPTNRLESIYSKFSINLRNCSDKVKAREILKNLVSDLDKLYISYQEFEEKFIKLSFSKSIDDSNMKAKYVVNKIASHYENTELFDDEGSVEHILPEADGNQNNNIGNLILLELVLNRRATSMQYEEKKGIYKTSKYKWMAEFIQENDGWETNQIENRAKKMAGFYYTKILNRSIQK